MCICVYMYAHVSTKSFSSGSSSKEAGKRPRPHFRLDDIYIQIYVRYIHMDLCKHVYVCVYMCRRTPSLPPAQKRLASGPGQTSGLMLGSFLIYIYICIYVYIYIYRERERERFMDK